MKVGDLVRHKIKNKTGVIIAWCSKVNSVGVLYGVYINGRVIPCHEYELEELCK